MSLSSGMEGLSLDQAPPLAIPFLFFAVAPLALVVAGLLLLAHGSGILVTGWLPETLTLTHLGTLGFLGSVMFGALYQMSPVVAVAPVPWIRHAYGVWLLNVVGLGLLVSWGARGVSGLSGSPWIPFLCLAAGALVFSCLVGWALWRSRAGGPTVWGMRLAVTCLFLALILGTLMVGYWGRGSLLGFDRELARESHVGLVLIGWVGGLLTAVSWQVLPMFYLTPEARDERPWLVLLTLVASLFSALAVLLFALAGHFEGFGSAISAVLLAPAACALWLAHPLWVLSLLRHRKRKRVDPSARFWATGMALGPATLVLGACAAWSPNETWGVAFLWCALLGWAGFTVHGMLTRIGPFLIWFHRFSPWVGLIPTPPMRRMLPDRLVWSGYALQAAALVLGFAAIAFQIDLVARAAGLCLVGLGGVLGAYLVILWRLHPETEGVQPATGTGLG